MPTDKEQDRWIGGRGTMNKFWSNVFAGTIGAVLSAAAMAGLGALWPLGLHLIIPPDAVIPMSGECPPGWRGYSAANGPYIVAPSDLAPTGRRLIGTAASEGVSKSTQGGTTGVSSSRLILASEANYLILNLCQRR